MDKQVYAVPKPKSKKGKKAVNNPPPSADDYCTVCGVGYAHNHEIIFGNGRRQLSIKYGMQVRLCQEHHQGNEGVHFNKEFDTRLKQQAQRRFEAEIGSREDFRSIFGESYILED
jgi:hypothetical protein